MIRTGYAMRMRCVSREAIAEKTRLNSSIVKVLVKR
jgi:hypothetical protein